MTLTQVVDSTRRLVINVASGMLNAQEVMENQQAIRSDPAFAGSFGSLVDLRRVVDIDISGEELRVMGQESPFNPEARRAYIVTSRSQCGVTRLYQAIINADPTNFRIFESWEEAVARLEGDEQRAATP